MPAVDFVVPMKRAAACRPQQAASAVDARTCYHAVMLNHKLNCSVADLIS
jgi:hypothetical protein